MDGTSNLIDFIASNGNSIILTNEQAVYITALEGLREFKAIWEELPTGIKYNKELKISYNAKVIVEEKTLQNLGIIEWKILTLLIYLWENVFVDLVNNVMYCIF